MRNIPNIRLVSVCINILCILLLLLHKFIRTIRASKDLFSLACSVSCISIDTCKLVSSCSCIPARVLSVDHIVIFSILFLQGMIVFVGVLVGVLIRSTSG